MESRTLNISDIADCPPSENSFAEALQHGILPGRISNSSFSCRQVATALQVCHSLGSLQPTVDGLLATTRDQLQTRLTDSLRLESVLAASAGAGTTGGRPGAAALPSNTVTFRAALWNNLERLADHIYGACAQIQHIHKVGGWGVIAHTQGRQNRGHRSSTCRGWMAR